MSKKHTGLKAWLFEDAKGKVVTTQTPNLPIIVWAVSRILNIFITGGKAGALLETVSFGALFTWAWLELFDGETKFRRILGFTVLVVTIRSKSL